MYRFCSSFPVVRNLCLAAAIAATQASAQQPAVDSDWPCIQRLVPVVSATTIWDGPALDEALGLTPEGLRRLFVEEAQVHVEIGNHYGEEGAGFVRLNIGCSRQLLEVALGRVKTAISASVAASTRASLALVLPMSMTASSPARSLPGCRKCPGLGRKKVTVRSA